jgi:hypothetical protein
MQWPLTQTDVEGSCEEASIVHMLLVEWEVGRNKSLLMVHCWIS